jgi:hypothetical protein
MPRSSKPLPPLLVHAYGAGACVACGGAVSLYLESAPRLVAIGFVGRQLEVTRCAHCGEVEYTLFFDDAGQPLQGFLPLAAVEALAERNGHAAKEIPI